MQSPAARGWGSRKPLNSRDMQGARAPVGIIMLQTRFPRPPGDIGNPASFPFPVRYRVVPRATVARVVGGPDEALLAPFVEAAVELEREGAGLIATSCGFLAAFQPALADAVRVPVVSSALLWVPLLLACLGPSSAVGVLTFDARRLGARHFQGVGVAGFEELVARGRLVVRGMEDTAFHRTIAGDLPHLDTELARAEHEQAATALLRQQPNVAAFVLECTNMPPYREAIALATGRPVFDILQLIRAVREGLPLPPSPAPPRPT